MKQKIIRGSTQISQTITVFNEKWVKVFKNGPGKSCD